jgi:hypothetical protein
MDFRQLKTLNIPEGVVIRIATPDGLVLWEKRGVEPDTSDIPNNEIWYTSTDRKIIELYDLPSDNTLISNTYENGIGKMVFEKELTEIGYNMFKRKDYYHNITTIIIPDSVTILDSWSFNDQPYLTKILLSNNLTTINEGAFAVCSGLPTIIIPEKIKSLGNKCFSGCNGLYTITCKAETAPTIQSETFFLVGTKVPDNQQKILYVPQNSKGYETWLSQLIGFELQYITE